MSNKVQAAAGNSQSDFRTFGKRTGCFHITSERTQILCASSNGLLGRHLGYLNPSHKRMALGAIVFGMNRQITSAWVGVLFLGRCGRGNRGKRVRSQHAWPLIRAQKYLYPDGFRLEVRLQHWSNRFHRVGTKPESRSDPIAVSPRPQLSELNTSNAAAIGLPR